MSLSLPMYEEYLKRVFTKKPGRPPKLTEHKTGPDLYEAKTASGKTLMYYGSNFRKALKKYY